jgi:hypothetical protein
VPRHRMRGLQRSKCCVAGCTFDRPLVGCIRDSVVVRALCLIWKRGLSGYTENHCLKELYSLSFFHSQSSPCVPEHT